MVDLVAKQKPIADVSFYDPKSEAEAKRKRAMADMLMQKGSQDFQNEKVGRYVVARSPWEFINQGAQSAYGQYLGAKADEQMADIEKRRQEAIAGALEKWGQGGASEAAQVLAQDPRTSDMAIQLMQQSIPEQYGIQSAGFEGDIARALQQKYMADGMSRDEAAQRAVIDTAQRMKGSWDPVSGNYVLNQYQALSGAGFNQPVPMPQGAPNPQNATMPTQQPTMQAPQGGLLPPPNMGGEQPDMSMFPQGQAQPQVGQIPPTGNRKLDAELAQAQAQQNMRVSAELNLAQQKLMQENQAKLPAALDSANYTLSLIDKALNHPGLSQSVGGAFGMQGRQAQAFPITEAQRNFQPIANQLRDRTFLEAFNQLRGGGAITEAEGQKATGAFFRLNQAQDEKSYRAALDELKGIIKIGIERAKNAATMTPQQNALGAINTIGSTTPTIPQQRRMKFDAQGNLL